MASAGPYSSVDDKDLDDATLWALMDSAATSLSKARKPLAIKAANHQTPPPVSYRSPPLLKSNKTPRSIQYSPQSTSKLHRDGEVVHEPWIFNRPQKIARTNSNSSSELIETSPIAVVTKSYRTPVTSEPFSPETYLSPGISLAGGNLMKSPEYTVQREETGIMRHSLSGMFPAVSLFKEYQNAAMAILEKTDYTMISGHPYIKKTGWRKISLYFNVSYEIKDKTIEFDEKRDVQRAEFIVRAHMQGGRFSDGWGSCDRREKRFNKPNHDIPSTAETRAKNKACQDLLGIGEYRPGASHS